MAKAKKPVKPKPPRDPAKVETRSGDGWKESIMRDQG